MRAQAIANTMNFTNAPAAAHGGDRPAHGRDPGDAVVDRLHPEQVQPGRRRQAPGRIDVQDVRPPGRRWSTSASTRTRPSTRRPRSTTTRSSRAPIGPNDFWTVNNAESASSACCRSTPPSRQSVNAVFARLAIDIGAYNVANMAYKLGIPKSDNLPDDALGHPGLGRRLAARHDPRVLDDRRQRRPPAAARGHQGDQSTAAVSTKIEARTRAWPSSPTAPPPT